MTFAIFVAFALTTLTGLAQWVWTQRTDDGSGFVTGTLVFNTEVFGNTFPARTYTIGPNLDLSGANLQGADLRGTNLQGADLRQANLDGADLSGARMRFANLESASIVDADLREADLWDTNLVGASLSRSDLTGADLHQADLFFTALQNSDLTNCNLRWVENAHLADFAGCTITGVDCSGLTQVLIRKTAEIHSNTAEINDLKTTMEAFRVQLLQLNTQISDLEEGIRQREAALSNLQADLTNAISERDARFTEDQIRALSADYTIGLNEAGNVQMKINFFESADLATFAPLTLNPDSVSVVDGSICLEFAPEDRAAFFRFSVE